MTKRQQARVELADDSDPADLEVGRFQAVLIGVAGVGVAVALYVWDDVFFAAPIGAASGLWNPWAAFLVFASVYALGSFLIAVVGVRAIDRVVGDEPTRLQQWLESSHVKRRRKIGDRFLETGKVVGFVISSIVLGGILTTLIVRMSGRRDRMLAIAAASCLIFGIGFAATYAGVFALIF
ncbi:MAG: hypothetical protein EDR02_14785 [Actinobacteria bacterium]|nr:MAG: hypothetical protein EDR02_14785 [Actinomycetota bacterium]RIK06376.1 MAG: hypothetical protein DCC48_08110 [Acidobacteriota bacterium]